MTNTCVCSCINVKIMHTQLKAKPDCCRGTQFTCTGSTCKGSPKMHFMHPLKIQANFCNKS